MILRFGRDQGYLDRDHRRGRRSDSDSDEELKGLSHEDYQRLKRLKMRKSGKHCIWRNTPSPLEIERGGVRRNARRGGSEKDEEDPNLSPVSRIESIDLGRRGRVRAQEQA
ncbi:hypothetical protein Bca52824_039026 [Brassica carinata]|uniref:Uncharacterized protein n=1 Tax=Brassica carinata TaxID=52824 RepID=A0A8X7RQR1_BRACI|nr:hypothetical protein Bca52824_039026 [Brassica carinata]